MQYTQHHSFLLCIDYWASFRQKMGDDVNLGDIFFFFPDRNVLSLCEGLVLCCNKHRIGAEYEWTLYPARNVCQLPRTVISYYSFFVVVDAIVHARIISVRDLAETKRKYQYTYACCWLAPFKCIYLGGSIAVFPCREISLTTSASIKIQFIQL